MKDISTILWLLAIVAISGTTALIVVRVSTRNQSPQANLQAQHDALHSETFRDAELADPFPPDSELERAEMEAIKRQLDINIFQGTLFESADGNPEDKTVPLGTSLEHELTKPSSCPTN